MEEHYECKILDLTEEMMKYKKASKLRSCLKKEDNKSYDKLWRNSSKQRSDNCMSSGTFGKGAEPDTSYREDIEYDTDITPADELNTTDRRKMMQNSENISNDNLLINFYKKKLNDRQNTETSQRPGQNYSQRETGPTKPRNEHLDREDDSNQTNPLHMQSSSQRLISGYVPKHYQIPKKDGSINFDTQVTSGTDISENLKKMYKQIK
jgi:hypothetical protein